MRAQMEKDTLAPAWRQRGIKNEVFILREMSDGLFRNALWPRILLLAFLREYWLWFSHHTAVEDIMKRHTDLLGKGWELGGKKHFMQWPKVDHWIVACTCEILRTFKPDVTFMHTGVFDCTRHGHGVFSHNLDECRANLDCYIGQVGSTLEELGLLEDTDFIMVSDHGQRDINRASISMSSSQMLSAASTPRRKPTRKNTSTVTSPWSLSPTATPPLATELFVLWCRTLMPATTGSAVPRTAICLITPPVFVAKGPGIKDGVMLGRSKVVDEAPTFAACWA